MVCRQDRLEVQLYYDVSRAALLVRSLSDRQSNIGFRPPPVIGGKRRGLTLLKLYLARLPPDRPQPFNIRTLRLFGLLAFRNP
jgi:hypothetical protein